MELSELYGCFAAIPEVGFGSIKDRIERLATMYRRTLSERDDRDGIISDTLGNAGTTSVSQLADMHKAAKATIEHLRKLCLEEAEKASDSERARIAAEKVVGRLVVDGYRDERGAA